MKRKGAAMEEWDTTIHNLANQSHSTRFYKTEEPVLGALLNPYGVFGDNSNDQAIITACTQVVTNMY